LQSKKPSILKTIVGGVSCIKQRITNDNVKSWFFTNIICGLLPVFFKVILCFVYFDQRDYLIPIYFGDFLILGLILNMGNIFYILNIWKNKVLTQKYLKRIILLLVFFCVLYFAYLTRNMNEYNSVAMIIFTSIFLLLTISVMIGFLSIEKGQK